MNTFRLSSFQGTKLERNALSKLNKTEASTVKSSLVFFLRKEVIQPHLPIRLPCYDFTPIICPTFGGWLP
jgi:hypothetical protein